MKPDPRSWFSRRFVRTGLVAASLVLAFGPRLLAVEEVFIKNCAPCHGPDGRARTPAARKLGVKDLTESKTTDAEIEKSIKEGRPDKSGKLVMPAFGEKVTAAELQTLIKTVKSLRKPAAP
jgi:mono/diheme cytochrome c family protein